MPVEAKDSASSEVVITAAKGWPFPMGLPKVTMSGTTSKEKHSYDLQATVHVLYTPQLLTLWTIMVYILTLTSYNHAKPPDAAF